ncbi:class I SAM-dependent methyltransferase [Ferviditalea candida]|uniref:Class I SAM-dependent methyltransferase n=1 Tax=Ferviditalea candida TaxID=3108399 RepID=A0ABU5ZH27_9BACL|nr:class I SAM-dependent methyltransferase [Paenibacillaceae bacterium T2]
MNKYEPEETIALLHSELFWNTVWAEAVEIFRRSHDTAPDLIETWNRRAEAFAKNVLGDKGRPRVQKIIRWLENQDVRLEGAKILDLGAGPGAFTLPFAAKADQVVALEPAKAMTRILREHLEEDMKNRVRIVEERGEDISIEEKGWKQAFDLVFISMNPGINNWELLEKAILCSKQYVYVSSFAGRRDNRALIELWPVLFGEEMPPWSLDIMYMMNLLYAKGYDLDIRIWEERHDKFISTEQAVEDLLIYVKLYKTHEFTDRMESHIRQYVLQNADEHGFLHQARTRLGKILIRLP